jgi:glutaminyl-peptide cyclotransferase
MWVVTNCFAIIVCNFSTLTEHMSPIDVTRYFSKSLLLFCLLIGVSCQKNKNEESKPDPLAIPFKLKTSWKHDPEAWTQGLVIHRGKLYEGTGQKKSWIGIVDIQSGKADKRVVLDDQYFGEGITILNNKVYQLTWKNKVGFIYDLSTFRKLGEFTYETEGWGLTHDGTNLIMSDGTETLTYLDTATLKPIKKLTVKDENGTVKKLNELEFIEGFIFANQWETNRIVKIDPATGMVVGRLDLTALVQSAAFQNANADVLNGIAYHNTTKLLVVTGKLWPSFFVIQLNQ